MASVSHPLTGWNLVQFTNGSAGVARWTGTGWDWGSLASEAQGLTISKVSFLGSTINAIATDPSSLTPIGKLPGDLSTAIIAVLDHGILAQGEPVLFGKGGQPVGNSGQTSSEASPSNIIPSPTIPGVNVGDVLSNIWTFLTTPAKWVRILEFVGGAVLVYMAVKGLTGIDTPSVTEVASKVVK